MSVEDHTDKGAEPAESATTARVEDDFVLHGQIDRSAKSEAMPERRMHLRAFDYWHGLNAGRQFPQFEDLTPEGLTPFKQNCLLLEYNSGDMVVRFCGAEMAVLFGGFLSPGTRLSSSQSTAFSRALQQRLSVSEGRQEAAEFEFVDEPVECRGTLLPFSARGELAEYIMVVVNHRRRGTDGGTGSVAGIGVSDPQPPASLQDSQETPDQAPEHASDQMPDQMPGQVRDQASEDVTDDAAEKITALAILAAECAETGGTVVHPGIGTREGLYLALAQAYQLHISAAQEPAAYKKLLHAYGMKQQQRAPYTPALKLTFGAGYDKTRLTEYAAALSCAARNEVGPEGLAEFLKNHPGGIKGCVQEERAARQGKGGKTHKMSLKRAHKKARRIESVSLKKISLNQEFSLALVRRNNDGSADLLSAVQTPQHIIDKAILQIASKDEN